MAKATIKMPEDFLLKLSRLGEKTDEIIPKVLEAGGEVVEAKVKSNLQAVTGSGTKEESRSTGELLSALATNLATKGDSITFSTPTIEGTVFRRNKLDGNGKHPWKTEVNEDDASVPASVISDWYTQVYEPVFTAQTGGES